MSKFLVRSVWFPGRVSAGGAHRLGRHIVCSVARQASLAFLFVVVSTSSRADTVYVDDGASVGGDGTSWATAYRHLQDALADAAPGDEIWVAQGTYIPDQDEAGNVTPGDRLATFHLISGVALHGGYAGLGTPDPDLRDIVLYQTILTGDLNGDDLPVACMQDSPDCDAFGSLCVDGTCIISDNNSENSYHVVTGNGTDASTIMNGFTIIGGNANGAFSLDSGGGMYNRSGSPTVTRCTFSGNSAAGFGGAMINVDNSPTVTNCSFIGNSADLDGGGMYTIGGSPTVTDCTFSGNSAAGLGGGMLNSENCPPVTNCTFSGNVATSGGGMSNVLSSATVTNCAFSGNSAAGLGGGMYNLSSDPTVTNCTFSGNSAAGLGGGGMSNSSGSSPTVNSSVFWGDSPEEIFNQNPSVNTPTVRFSDVQGGLPPGTIDGGGNIDADPLFVDADGPDNIPGTDDDDLRLRSGSPCIDAGDPAVMFVPGETDLDGHARVLCARVDMGAYEFGIGDHKCDRDVDLLDFANWADCMTGPDNGPFPVGCEAFDFDGDLDVDLEDFGGFQQVFNACTADAKCDDGAFCNGSETCDPVLGCVSTGNPCLPGESCNEETDTCESQPGGPPNDYCANPTAVGDGATEISNEGATTDGPDEPAACNFFDYTQLDSDIWFCYDATCDGEAVVSLCGSEYDTKMAVYAGCDCPTAPPIACSDDDCGVGFESRVTFQAQTGQSYLIRIGGFQGAQGNGTLNILCGVDVCGPGNGDCGSANGSRGCDDAECCNTTCAVDPFCCDVEWDEFCANESIGLCSGSFGSCAPGAGSCAAGNGSPGCDEIACCNAVCMDDPFCCVDTWDEVCAEAALGSTCFLACGGQSGGCFTSNGSPGCESEACCETVCNQDSFCCLTEWDQSCADMAATKCR